MLYSSPFVITLSTSRLKASSPISPQDVTHSKGWGVILTPAVISFLALFSWAVYCCFVADQHKWFSFFLLLPSASLLSLSTLSSSPPQHQLLSPFLSLSLQISSARKLLLLLQLAAARLHLLHVSAWALSLSLSTHSLSRFLPSLHSPSSSSLSRHYGDTLSLYQDKLVLARSLSLCVCVLLELKEFSSDVNIQNKNYIANNKMWDNSWSQEYLYLLYLSISLLII